MSFKTGDRVTVKKSGKSGSIAAVAGDPGQIFAPTVTYTVKYDEGGSETMLGADELTPPRPSVQPAPPNKPTEVKPTEDKGQG